MSWVTVQTPVHVALEFTTAPVVRRILAWGIDTGILMVYATLGLALLDGFSLYTMGWRVFTLSLPILFYHLLMEIYGNGQSIGKRIFTMRVMSLSRGEPGYNQHMLRWLFRFWEWPMIFATASYYDSSMLYVFAFVSSLMGIGVLISVGVTPRHQRLGDLAADTAVVDLRSIYKLHDTIFREVTQPDYVVQFPGVMQLSDRDINAIHGVIRHAHRSGSYDVAERVAQKVSAKLEAPPPENAISFLRQLINDYNYLATRQN